MGTWRMLELLILLAAVGLTTIGRASATTTQKMLYEFAGGSKGYYPNTRLIYDNAGNLYGTSGNGGIISQSCPFGCGLVFELSPPTSTIHQWTEHVLYAFAYGNDAGFPQGGLTFDSAGNLYGAAGGGGTHGNGAVFKLTRTGSGWTESLLYSFCAPAGCSDGSNPQGGVIFDKAGNLYGVTSGGGANGAGTVYQLQNTGSGWSETVLYNFCSAPGCTDGASSVAALVMDGAGNLYGTTTGGGANSSGVVFELSKTSSGWTQSVLYTFCSLANCADGATPNAGLVLDSAGNLYGTTSSGGGVNGAGTAFELTRGGSAWSQSILHAFLFGTADGGVINAGVVFDSKGNLWGTTSWGGTGCGTVFELTPGANGWSENLLSFSGKTGGAPYAGLVLAPGGSLLGTTQGGGAAGLGTVFQILP